MAALPAAKAIERARTAGLDEYAANNLVSYLAEQRDATSRVPDDVTIVVERFRDELGDWRVCVHSPYGGQVHGPWALAIAARLRERYGMDAQSVSGDDGIVLRLPETDELPPGAELVLFDPAEIEDLVTAEVGGSALFAARFRECAARALLLPRRNPGRRSPLWQQRQRSAQLLSVASKYGSFPIVLETLREVLQDVYDLPALKDLLTGISERRISVVEVETAEASPFAKSLLFGYVGAFMYEGDSPLAEKRAAALALDQSLLAELLGRTELRELLDAEVVLRTEAELQRLAEDRRARDAEGLFDVLRMVGPLSLSEASQRCVDGSDAESWLTSLAAARRVVRVRIAGEHRWAVVEDVARLRDALGVPLPPGVAEAHAEPVADPLGRPGLPLRADARAFPGYRSCDASGDRRCCRHRGVAAVGCGGAGRRGRVPAWRDRSRVVRQRDPALAPAAVSGGAAQGGRAGRSIRARPLPARLARHHEQPRPWVRRTPRRGRAVGRMCGAGVSAGVDRAAVAGAGVSAVDAGRADGDR